MAFSTISIREEIYNEVKKIPEGRVTTYGEIANQIKKLKIKNQNDDSKLKISKRFAPRFVGFVLHQNKSADVPCHRVVDRNGRLAPNFAFDGAIEQKRRLEAEGVEFVDKTHVDLEKCFWQV